MQKRLPTILIEAVLLVAGPSLAGAQKAANPLCAEVKQAVDRVANNLLKLAEKMPEDQYGYQVVPDIATFAGTLRSTIDLRMRTCAGMTGSGARLDASNRFGKADLLVAMKSSIAECDRAFGGLTDADLVQISSGGSGKPRSRLASLYGMVAHDSEAYGSLALHLRLRGIEPPAIDDAWVR